MAELFQKGRPDERAHREPTGSQQEGSEEVAWGQLPLGFANVLPVSIDDATDEKSNDEGK